MKKIYSLLFVSLFLFIGYSCDDGSLSHSDVYIPDPVEETDEDDGFSAEPTTEAVIKVQFGEGHEHQIIEVRYFHTIKTLPRTSLTSE